MKNFINNQRLAELAGVTFKSERIQEGPIVYSRTHTVVKQFGILSHYPECVLVTSFSDADCTDEMAEQLPSNVKMWFSNNVATSSPRVTAVPIGLRTSPDGEERMRKAMEVGRLPERNLVYMNFWRKIPQRHDRPVNPRAGLYEMFENKEWVTTEGGFDHVSMNQFYEQMLSHPFILSPPGAGPDCHRHWESILLGSIPIVLKSPATRLLEGLPCLQVNHWGEVTPERLKMEYPELKKLFHSQRMDICWFEFWKDLILETASERG